MRAQRDNGDVHFEVVNFVDHAILFVDASRPRFFIDKMLQVFHLPCTCAWMLLKFNKQVSNLLDSFLVATALDGSKFCLRLFREIYNEAISYKSLIMAIMSSLLSKRVNFALGR